MNGAQLRHQNPGIGRAPARKPVPRGASRLVSKPPLSARLARPGLGLFKRLGWPLLLLALGVAAYQLSQRLLPYADRPIASVSVEGDLRYLSRDAVRQRIARYAASTFFEVDLVGMQSELERMSWIAHAEVRRVWPDQLVVHLQEQLPVARWGDGALLNNAGEAFAPRDLAHYEHLPQLYGPQRAQQQVMQQYQILSQMLRPLGFAISRLELHERGSWFLTMSGNDTQQPIELLLGRDPLVEKMRRFAAIYDKALKPQIANIERVDLRYPNGLAVGWRAPVAPVVAAATTQN